MSKRRSAKPPKASRPTAAENILRVQSLINEGARLLAARRPGEAIPLLQEAYALDPDNVTIALNLGGAYILQNKHAQATPILERAAEIEPDNPMIWTNLAAAHLGKLLFAKSEQQDRAIAAFERALALDPRTPNVHYNLGLIYLERNDLQRAAAHFRGALETDPDDRDARNWLDKILRAEPIDRALLE